MELEQTNFEVEKKILNLLIYSTEFVSTLRPNYADGVFDNRYITKLAQIAIKHYDRFNTCIGDKINDTIAKALAANKVTQNHAAEMRVVLAALDPSLEADVDYEVITTVDYFIAQCIRLKAEEALALLDKGKIEEAQEVMEAPIEISREQTKGGNLSDYDDEEIDSILNDKEESIIRLKYALGQLLNDVLVREGVVALLGRNKVGKSHWLIYLARMARNQGKFVIFFTVGDMSKRQCERRIMQADAETSISPKYAKNQRKSCLDCISNQKGICFERESNGNLLDGFNEIKPEFTEDSGYKPCTKCKGRDGKAFQPTVSYLKVSNPVLDKEVATQVRDKIAQTEGMGILHVEPYPNSTARCSELNASIRRICKLYGKEHPDCVVLDYADVMDDECEDERKSVNKRWKFFRRCSDIWKCLFITATQANALGLSFEDLTMQANSEDKRKLDHVTAYIAINQTPEERKENIWRLAALNKREHPFDEAKQAVCYGCLSMGTPHQVSLFKYAKPPKPKTLR